MSERNYYVLCDDNCRFPAMTAEQTLAAIAEATGKTPTDVDKAFITKLREGNSGANFSIWIGTTAEYLAIEAAGERVKGCLYITTDDNTLGDILAATARLYGECERLTAENASIKAAIYGDYLGTNDQQSPLEIQTDMLVYDYFTFVDENGDTIVKFDLLDKIHDPDGIVDYISGCGFYWKSGIETTTASLTIEKNNGNWYISSYYSTESGTGEFSESVKVYGHKYPKSGA